MCSSIKFLIVVPIFNSLSLLPKFTHSLLSQTHNNWRVLFIDGGSNDSDINYLDLLCASDSHFSYQHELQDSKGIFSAMNQGFKTSDNNEYTLFWGSDDWPANKYTLEDISNFVLSYRSSIETNHFYIFSSRYFSNKLNCLVRKSSFPNIKFPRSLAHISFRLLLFLGFTPPHQATLFSPLVKKLISEYNPKYKLSADLDYFLRLSSKTIVNFKVSTQEVVYMSDSGTSSASLGLRLLNVLSSYFNSFGIFFPIPFLLRYFNRLISKFNHS